MEEKEIGQGGVTSSKIWGFREESPRADDDRDLDSENSSDRRRLLSQQAERTLVSFLP